MPLVVDTKVAGTPAVDVVELLGVLNRPFLHLIFFIIVTIGTIVLIAFAVHLR